MPLQDLQALEVLDGCTMQRFKRATKPSRKESGSFLLKLTSHFPLGSTVQAEEKKTNSRLSR